MLNSTKALIILVIVVALYINRQVENFVVTRPSKCFSCEKQIINKSSIWNVWKALPTKCFDCEKNIISKKHNPYNTGPNKCFDCDYFKINKTNEK